MTFQKTKTILVASLIAAMVLPLAVIGFEEDSSINTLRHESVATITLIGDNPQTIELGDGYTELGANASDDSPVEIDASQFVDAVGTYSIYYDSFDYTAIQVVRIVDVVAPEETDDVGGTDDPEGTDDTPEGTDESLQDQIDALEIRIIDLESSIPVYYTVMGDTKTITAFTNQAGASVSCNDSNDIAISSGMYTAGSTTGLDGLIIISSTVNDNGYSWKYTLANISDRNVNFTPVVLCVSYSQ